MRLKRAMQNTLISIFFLACSTGQKKSPNFTWGQNIETIKISEADRLRQSPLEERAHNPLISSVTYEDRFLNAQCHLSYWFEKNRLELVSYSCSNPDWDEEELKGNVRQKMASLHGEPEQVATGEKWYDHYRAQDAHIYFRLVRIPSDSLAFRTFQANIFYAQKSHKDSKLLQNILSTFGR